MMRQLLLVFALIFPACGDDSGSATGGTGGTSGSGGSGGSSIDAPVVDAPAPDGPPGTLGNGDPCGAMPGTDGGVFPGDCMPGLLCCLDGQQLGAHHCRPPAPTNDAGIGTGQCALPDLMLDQDRLRAEVGISEAYFSSTSCSVVEGCVAADGKRRLLHFSVVTPNMGDADMYLGRPSANNPIFQYSQCHNHYHFAGYALYEVLDGSGNVVVTGRKRAFCLEDFERQSNPPLGGPARAQYDCSDQGISMGWADTYYNGLSCQFMDLSGLAAGHYTLRVTINPDRILEELSYDNNAGTVEFDLSSEPQVPSDPCNGSFTAGTVPDHEPRECGWTDGGTFSCTAGQQVQVGCGGTTCGAATCTGDPILRVCDAANASCTFGTALAHNDDCSNGNRCSLVTFTCPASGMYKVYSAPFTLGDAVTCNITHNP
jgi:lysyl oxidase